MLSRSPLSYPLPLGGSYTGCCGLNLWRGFSVEPKDGDWGLLRTHVWENICKGQQHLFDYLIRWAAKMVQNPDEPGRVAVVLRGKRGVGKGVFAQALGIVRAYLAKSDQTN